MWEERLKVQGVGLRTASWVADAVQDTGTGSFV